MHPHGLQIFMRMYVCIHIQSKQPVGQIKSTIMDDVYMTMPIFIFVRES